ncbi:hypothetical protein Tco_0631836 [Tanacetum coccineum]
MNSDIEELHHGPSDALHNPSQPFNEDGNPARANIKQALGRLYGGGGIPFQLRLIHHHMLMLKLQRHTLSIKIQASRFKNQESSNSKTKTFANFDIKDPSSEIKLRGRFLESFQDDAKYEHVGQDTRLQDDKDVNVIQGKDFTEKI